MTVEEIKQQYSMREIVERYGIKVNRAGFCSCCFHSGDRTPSMKIYKRDYHCHACGANGDIFSFVQGIESCDFKAAFKLLGGTYKHQSEQQHKINQYRMQKRKETMLLKEQKKQLEKKALLEELKLQKIFVKVYPVFSDEWCDAMNRLELLFYKLECLEMR